MQRRTPNLLEPKRSVLAGLVKSLAVGYGFNEFSPSANGLFGCSIILARQRIAAQSPDHLSLPTIVPSNWILGSVTLTNSPSS